MRKPILFALLSVAAACAVATPVAQTIDLDSESGQRALAAAGAAHQQLVSAIIRDAEHVSCASMPKIIPALHAVDDVRCQSLFIMTSNPAKRRLEFTLEDRRYKTVIRLLEEKGGLMPLVDRREPTTAPRK